MPRPSVAFLSRVLFALTMLASLAFPVAGRAEDLSGADQETIRSIISGQMDAFLRDDGGAAYSYASPGIRTLYPTVEAFMGMVTKGFPPVYRPQSRTFGPILAGPNGPLQRVFITGPDGKNWIAEYTLQRQPDGTWRINGCKLLEDTGATI